MVLRQREFTFVTNSKIISWPVCTSLHSCSNPFPQFRKELFVLEYNVIKQRMLDKMYLCICSRTYQNTCLQKCSFRTRNSVFSWNFYVRKIHDFGLKMGISNKNVTILTRKYTFLVLKWAFRTKMLRFWPENDQFEPKTDRYHLESVWREQKEWVSNQLKVKYD